MVQIKDDQIDALNKIITDSKTQQEISDKNTSELNDFREKIAQMKQRKDKSAQIDLIKKTAMNLQSTQKRVLSFDDIEALF